MKKLIPSGLTLLLSSLRYVKVLLVFNASARNAAPLSPIAYSLPQ
ncbi:hypothetical protein [Rickettsia australis]|nr:hypothetical protein [Rickettsia australis]